MSLLDFHAKNLLPTVWSPDGTLMMRFRAQLREQVKHRFAYARDVLLVGDTVSRYWKHDSDVDVLLLVDDADMVEAAKQVKRASGFPLLDTDNQVRFWPIMSGMAPSVVAKHFGAVYSTRTGRWYGQHVRDTQELQRVDGLLHYANWRLFKAKHDEDPFPYDWKILTTAFKTLDTREREQIIDETKFRIAHVDRNVTRLLKNQTKEIWKAAERFDQELVELEDIPANVDTIPRRVALAILHRFRYQDLLGTLVDLDDKMHQRSMYTMARTTRVAKPRKDVAPQPESSNTAILRKRLLQTSEMLLMRQGGSANAINAIYDQIQFLLDQNRYVLTDMRRRRVAYRIYKRYYLGKYEE